MDEFLNFRKFVSASLVKFMWYAGTIIIFFFGVFSLASNTYEDPGLFTWIFLLGGLLTWRVVCEILILFFRMYDQVSEANARLGSIADLVRVQGKSREPERRLPSEPIQE